MTDDETFNEIIADFTFPAVTLPLEDWPTEDLVTLSLKIDAELQKRADDLGYQEYEMDKQYGTTPPWVEEEG